MKQKASGKTKSTIGIPKKDFWKWVAILFLATLPFFHDIITGKGTGTNSWVPNLGIEEFLTDSEGYVLGYSSYRVFLYTIAIHVGMHIAFLGWFMDAKGKNYRVILLLPVTLTFYQIVIILTGSRFTDFNSPSAKFFLLLSVSLFLGILYFFKNKNVYYPPDKEEDA